MILSCVDKQLVKQLVLSLKNLLNVLTTHGIEVIWHYRYIYQSQLVIVYLSMTNHLKVLIG